MDRAHRRARAGVALMTCGLLLAPMGIAGAQQGASAVERDDTTPALTTPFLLVHDRDVDDRLPQPEDRYALARGCYAIEVAGEGWVTRGPDGIVLAPDASAAEPFHFQPLRLGQYLLATNEGPDDSHPDAWWDDRGYLAAAGLLPELPLPDPGLPLPGDGLFDTFPWPDLPTTNDVAVASTPGTAAEWEVVAADDDADARDEAGQDYRLALRDGRALSVSGGALTLGGDGADVRFHLAEGCAVWPEIDTNTSGAPSPVIAPEDDGNGGDTDDRRRGGPPAGTPGGPPAGTPGGPPVGTPANPGPDHPAPNPAAPVQGFFESHVHGMAYEFLGGELRCGQPWHPYGVEYALPDCRRDGQVLNPVLEVALAGDDDPMGYDPVGWPTFETWPAHELLTHEQWYWKWVERAHHGGMRLLTNLLVDNTALCQLYPQKRNSCNEMDSVRLQADRMFELQDYIDAQYGGPGEGWFRIVTSPAQARQAINAGRLAVVLGIEVSNLLDCNDLAGEPTCTEGEIDERLQEVFDMGVRQMEIINKFDNGLSGVTGDGGATGIIVNQGNRYVTGHYWDMRTCPEEAGHGHDGHHGHGHAHEGEAVHLPGNQHDKHQMNPSDEGFNEAGEVDVLVGQILNEFGDVTSYAAPIYPAGPHCNELGLTDMGRHAIWRMLEMGIIFDPDHMSARGMREALDMIEHEYIPQEIERAEAEGRAPILPGLISSHSWGNNVIYQRLYQLGGTVGPRTNNAHTFAGYWHERREWFDELAPEGLLFGMGYGADTNGFGAQPGPRGGNVAEPVTYTEEGFEAPIGGVTIYQQVSGVKPYDINTDGVAHYGLFADWFHEVALAAEQRYGPGAGEEITRDMLNAAENYIQMWERATYGGNDCVIDHSTLQVEDVHALLGLNLEGFLRSVGAPVSRDGAAYTYCATNLDGVVEVLDVHFDAAGRASMVAPNPGTVTPSDTSRFPGDAHDHAHALGAPLPATGAGLAAIGLFLLGLAVLSGHLLRGARGATDQLLP
jgi:hypothetical protein